MDERSPFSVPEIVGIASVGAAALGGVIIALSRAQGGASRTEPPIAAAQDALGSGISRGRESALYAASRLASRLPALRDEAAERLTQVGERVGERVHVDPARVMSAASAGVEHARSAGATVAERLQETVAPALASAAGAVAETASEAWGGAEPAASGVVGSLQESAERAVETSANIVKETLATLFWLIAASMLVYLVLLSPERRDRLKAAISGALSETRLLIEDFQGYDEEI